MLTHQELGQFLDEHFGDRLRQRGFVPHPRRPCQWYKVVKDEVLLGFITEPGIVFRDDFNVKTAYYPLFRGEYLPYSKSNQEEWLELATDVRGYCPRNTWIAEECCFDMENKVEMEQCMHQGWLCSIGSPLHPKYYRTTIYYLDCLLEEKVFPILDPIVDVRTCAEQYVRQKQKRFAECRHLPDNPNRIPELMNNMRYLYECIYLDNVEECNWYRDEKIRPAAQRLSAKALSLSLENDVKESYKQRIEKDAAYYSHLLEGLSEEGYGTLKREMEEKRNATYEAVKKKLKLK